MSLSYTVKPLTDYTIFTTGPDARKSVQFKVTWDRTRKDLGYELEHLQARDVVLELAVNPSHVRRDGMLKADAKVRHPGVRLSFDSEHGALSYTCDTYESRYYGQMADWQANVRAIVLTLEALRAVDRYGATKGEQYSGFAALPAGNGGIALGGMTRDEALAELGHPNGEEFYTAAWKRARAEAHPDRNGGDQARWDRVEEAARVLGIRS